MAFCRFVHLVKPMFSFVMEEASCSLIFLRRITHGGEKHFIIDIVITRYLTTVITVFLNDFRKIVVDSIKFQIMVVAPADGMVKCLAGSAGPEDEFVSLISPFNKIIYEWSVRLTFTVTVPYSDGELTLGTTKEKALELWHFWSGSQVVTYDSDRIDAIYTYYKN